jgi:hypothetical protein
LGTPTTRDALKLLCERILTVEQLRLWFENAARSLPEEKRGRTDPLKTTDGSSANLMQFWLNTPAGRSAAAIRTMICGAMSNCASRPRTRMFVAALSKKPLKRTLAAIHGADMHVPKLAEIILFN